MVAASPLSSPLFSGSMPWGGSRLTVRLSRERNTVCSACDFQNTKARLLNLQHPEVRFGKKDKDFPNLLNSHEYHQAPGQEGQVTESDFLTGQKAARL